MFEFLRGKKKKEQKLISINPDQMPTLKGFADGVDIEIQFKEHSVFALDVIKLSWWLYQKDPDAINRIKNLIREGDATYDRKNTSKPASKLGMENGYNSKWTRRRRYGKQ